MTRLIPFNGADGIKLPFLITIGGGLIVDISGATVGASLFWLGELRHGFAVGDGIEIVDQAPKVATGNEVQRPHGILNVSGGITIAVPRATIIAVRIQLVTQIGLELSTRAHLFQRRL